MSEYDKMLQKIKNELKQRKNRNYKTCKNLDTDACILWAACNDCYYYYEKKSLCPFCERAIPNTTFLFKNGCRWCQQKGVKNE